MVKNPPASAGDSGDPGSIPGSGRFSGEGNGNPLQCSCWGMAKPASYSEAGSGGNARSPGPGRD